MTSTMDDSELAKVLAMTGFVETLLRLDKDEESITDLIRDKHNPDGVASAGVVKELRAVFKQFGLVEEVSRRESTRPGKPSIYLVLTDKGQRVVDALKKVLSEMPP